MNKKGILEFELEDPDAREAFKRAVLADEAYRTLSDISDEIFRPHRKHGYSDRRIQSIIDRVDMAIPENESNPVLDVIELLEENFRDILIEHGVTLE